MTVQILVRPWAGFKDRWWATVIPFRPRDLDRQPDGSIRPPDWRDICFDCGAYASAAHALLVARDYCRKLGWRVRKITREGKA